MDFKKIACTAIRRWNEKRHTDKTAGTRRTTLPETQKPQPAQGVPTAQPAPAAHHLLHRHVLVQSAFRPFGKPQVHLRARGASHRQHGHRPRANLRPTESGTGKRGTVLVQPRGRERPAVAQCGFLPHLPGRGSVAPLLSCGSAEREGTPALSARNIRTVAAAGTRSDGRHNAAQAGSSPRSRRSTENTHTLRKPVPRGGNMKKRPQHLAIPMKSRNFAPLFSIIERCTHRVMVRLSINHLI